MMSTPSCSQTRGGVILCSFHSGQLLRHKDHPLSLANARWGSSLLWFTRNGRYTTTTTPLSLTNVRWGCFFACLTQECDHHPLLLMNARWGWFVVNYIVTIVSLHRINLYNLYTMKPGWVLTPACTHLYLLCTNPQVDGLLPVQVHVWVELWVPVGVPVLLPSQQLCAVCTFWLSWLSSTLAQLWKGMIRTSHTNFCQERLYIWSSCLCGVLA